MDGVKAVILQRVITVLIDCYIHPPVKHTDWVAYCPEPRVLTVGGVIETYGWCSAGSGGKFLLIVLVWFIVFAEPKE